MFPSFRKVAWKVLQVLNPNEASKSRTFSNCHVVLDSRIPGSGTQEDVFQVLPAACSREFGTK